jgi:hypothetical protein
MGNLYTYHALKIRIFFVAGLYAFVLKDTIGRQPGLMNFSLKRYRGNTGNRNDENGDKPTRYQDNR